MLLRNRPYTFDATSSKVKGLPSALVVLYYFTVAQQENWPEVEDYTIFNNKTCQFIWTLYFVWVFFFHDFTKDFFLKFRQHYLVLIFLMGIQFTVTLVELTIQLSVPVPRASSRQTLLSMQVVMLCYITIDLLSKASEHPNRYAKDTEFQVVFVGSIRLSNRHDNQLGNG